MTPTADRARNRSRLLLVLGVLVGALVVVGFVLATLLGPDGTTYRPAPPSPTPAATSPSPTASAPSPTPSAVETRRPTPTALPSGSWPAGDVGEFLEPEVAGFEARGFTEDSSSAPDGAVEAYEGTYGDALFDITVRVTSWESRAAAEQAVVTAAEAQFAAAEPLKAGDVGAPDVVGAYRYYEQDGRATVFWNDGPVMVIAEGEPLAVQEFFVLHPRRG